MTTRAWTCLTAAAIPLLLAACARPHLVPGFGRSYREAFPAQAVSPGKPAAPPNMKLDGQESEVIAAGYLRGLSGKTKEEPEPVLYVAPQKGGAATPLKLAPSVPKE